MHYMCICLYYVHRRHHDERVKAAAGLRHYVESEARERSPEKFTKFMSELNKWIMGLVNSSDSNSKLAGIMALDELIDVPYEENETKIIRFANYLRMVLKDEKYDASLLVMASRAFGIYIIYLYIYFFCD